MILRKHLINVNFFKAAQSGLMSIRALILKQKKKNIGGCGKNMQLHTCKFAYKVLKYARYCALYFCHLNIFIMQIDIILLL